MSVGIAIVAHGKLASSLLSAAEGIIGQQEDVAAVDVSKADSSDTIREKIESTLDSLDRHDDGVLVLTDLFGGSSCNVCLSLSRERKIKVVTGVSMPMLLKAISHKDQVAIDELVLKTCHAGQSGIVDANARLAEIC
jgi:PTS system mannose-specific IIA component